MDNTVGNIEYVPNPPARQHNINPSHKRKLNAFVNYSKETNPFIIFF